MRREMKPKNVIFFFCDQFRADALGYAGHSIVKTPNLDKLAEQSINFPNTFLRADGKDYLTGRATTDRKKWMDSRYRWKISRYLFPHDPNQPFCRI